MISREELLELNERYGMFYNIADELPDGDFHFSAKDNLTTKDLPTTAGSRMLGTYRPPFDAAAVEALKKTGGILLGKTSMDEFGFGTFSTNSAFDIPCNPFDTERSCGGSSGGAACAASLIGGHIALGVSTGGSISCPASFCGVVGLTPTYGRVSRYGLIDYANSLDKIGMLAASCKDISKHIKKIIGEDPRDPTSCSHPPWHERDELNSIAVPRQALDGIPKEIISPFEEALCILKKEMGMNVEMVDVPMLRYAEPAYYVIATSEASTNLARYGGMRYGAKGNDLDMHFDRYFSTVRSENFGEEVKRRIMLGTYTRMVGFRDRYYIKALRVRQALIKDYKRIFEIHDLLLTPTMPFIAPRFKDINMMSSLETYLSDRLTIPPNLTGMPHLSIPCGYVERMPIGMQFVAPHWEEGALLYAGLEWEKLFEYHAPEDRI